MNLADEARPQMRKRPVQARSHQTVGTLLAAASQILEREGAEKLTTNHLAEHAGFSVGTVYQYFPDKRALLSALADRGQMLVQDEMRAEVRQAAPCDLETIARILVRGTIRCNCEFRDKVRAMVVSRFERREFRHVMDQHAIFARFVQELLAEFAAETTRPLSDTASYVLVSAILGAIQCAFLADSPLVDSAELENELVTLFLEYTRSGRTESGAA
jgi:AcrR family transcriptional regulator